MNTNKPFINLHHSHTATLRIETLLARGQRETQEDRIVVHHFERGILLAILDGHGGSSVSDKAAKRLPGILEQHLIRSRLLGYGLNRETPDQAIKKAIRGAVKELSAGITDKRTGSTLSLAFIETGCEADISDPLADRTPMCRVTTAQLGDSIIAIEDGRRCTIAPLHTTTGKYAAKDLANIERRYLVDWPASKDFRVIGKYIFSVAEDPFAGIALTRALGDKAHYLSDRPTIATHRIRAEEINLMLASDGLFDSLDRSSQTITPHILNTFIRKTVRSLKQGEFPRAMKDNLSLVRFHIDASVSKSVGAAKGMLSGIKPNKQITENESRDSALD